MKQLPVLLALAMSIILNAAWFSQRLSLGFFSMTESYGDVVLIILLLSLVIGIFIRASPKNIPLSIDFSEKGFKKIKKVFGAAECVHCFGKGLCNCRACAQDDLPVMRMNEEYDNRGRRMRDNQEINTFEFRSN